MKLMFGFDNGGETAMENVFALGSFTQYLRETFKAIDCGAEIDLFSVTFRLRGIDRTEVASVKVRRPYKLKNIMTKTTEHFSGLVDVIIRLPELRSIEMVDSTDFAVFAVKEFIGTLSIIMEKVPGMDVKKFESELVVSLNGWRQIHAASKQ